MKKLSKILLISVLSAFLMAGVVVTSATAGPIPPSPQPVPSAGESDLFSFTIAGDNVNVDWMVIPYTGGLFDFLSGAPIPAGGFLYAYQVENATASVGQPNTFTVQTVIGLANPGLYLGGGFIFGDDLDVASAVHPAHSAVAFPGLAGEEEPFLLPGVTTPGFDVTPADGTVTWTWDAIPVGTETDTLFFVHAIPPSWGRGSVLDGAAGPWDSMAPGGDPVPVPVPEPATMTLLGIGLLGLGGIGRKKFSKK
jgi:hypothetical protein